MNETTIEELRSIYFSGNGLVPVVGAGTSILLGIPSWETLVKEYYKFTKCNINFEEQCDLHQNDWPTITDNIFTSTGSDIDKYYNFLENYVKPKESDTHGLPIRIIKYFDRIITTNFDNTFDSTEKLLAPEKSHKKMIWPDINATDFNDKVIAYIHGKVAEKRVVFKDSEYKIAYNSGDEIKTLLTSVIKKHSLLFIGFSFKDKVFKENLYEIIKTIRKNAETKREIIGHEIPGINAQKMYVILEEKDTLTDLTIESVSKIGINLNELDIFLQKIKKTKH